MGAAGETHEDVIESGLPASNVDGLDTGVVKRSHDINDPDSWADGRGDDEAVHVIRRLLFGKGRTEVSLVTTSLTTAATPGRQGRAPSPMPVSLHLHTLASAFRTIRRTARDTAGCCVQKLPNLGIPVPTPIASPFAVDSLTVVGAASRPTRTVIGLGERRSQLGDRISNQIELAEGRAPAHLSVEVRVESGEKPRLAGSASRFD